MNHLGVMPDTNKCALVTASSKGLGKVIAKEFASNGYDIILHGRDQEKVYKTHTYASGEKVFKKIGE